MTKFLVPIDLTKNELQNAAIQNLAAAPSTPVSGQVYFNTTDDLFYIWNGAAWVTWLPTTQKAAANGVASLNASSKVVQDPANAQTAAAANKIPLAGAGGKIENAWLNTGSGNGFDADTVDGNHAAALMARANHTGTQLANTVSDFDTQVRTSRLDQMAAPTADVSLNSRKITSLLAPTAAGDAANKAYVDGLVNGVEIHPSVKAATTANIILSGPQTVDGVALIAGDRVLVKNQTAAQENGIHVVAAGAWARALDADSWDEIVSAFVFVEQGTTQADTAWVSTADAGGTLNTTVMPWTQFAAPAVITASNQGTGQGVFISKIGNDLQFKNVKSADSKITVTTVSNDIVITLVPGAIEVDSLAATTPLSVAKGGTGAATAAAARTALGATTKFAASIGNNTLTTFAVTHSLNTTDVIVMVKEVGTPFAVVYPDVQITDGNNVQVTFTVAPTTNQYRVIVIG